MNWSRQTDEPLFPDILWSRPENRRHAGKLLIVGGHLQSFSAVSQAYSAAEKAGIGTSRVIVPGKLQKLLAGMFPEAEFAASTGIGSFSREALADILDTAEWADGVLLAGDFSKNSEVSILLEKFIGKYTGQLTITGDGLDYFAGSGEILQRSDTVLCGELPRIQKLATPQAVIRQSDDFIRILEALGDLTSGADASLITAVGDQIAVAHKGKVSATKASNIDLTAVAAYAAVWRIQQPDKPFEALTTAIWCYSNNKG